VSTQGIPVVSGSSTTILPTILTRQASTTVQLYDGQSFAIGGLIKSNITEIISAFPGLASIPIIGALFRSSSFSSGRTELLIIVTPRIVKPLSEQPQLPTDKFRQPSQSEFFLEGKMEGDKPIAQQPNASPTSVNGEVK
jgi:pilus assembly protein CpaC